AHAGDTLLMHLVIVEGPVVRYHHEKRYPIVHRGPQRRRTHEEIAITTDGDRQPPAVLERKRSADRNTGARAYASAAIRAQEVERMAEWPGRPVPRQRQMRERDRAIVRR